VLLKSTFESDLQKEQSLAFLLDAYYQKHLKAHDFERVSDIKQQIKGIDLVFTNKISGERYYIDEKAQLDYINETLPTFAFELAYSKNGESKEGWLYDSDKKTHFYALITAIFADEPNKFTSCKITFVNREKLTRFLASRNISKKSMASEIKKHPQKHSKLKIDQLDSAKEGYLYFSSKNKAEKPINLVLKLDFLIKNQVARQFI